MLEPQPLRADGALTHTVEQIQVEAERAGRPTMRSAAHGLTTSRSAETLPAGTNAGSALHGAGLCVAIIVLCQGSTL
jgi:hypothetical protein